MNSTTKKTYLHDRPDETASGLERNYDPAFVVTPAYRESLPDMQNADISTVRGSHVGVQQVGISNFRLPLKFSVPSGEPITLETSVTGTVSLEANKKGINMSRIMRTFYEYKDEEFSLSLLADILKFYKKALDSFEARIRLRFSYPMLQKSLRSGLEGYQYYDCSYEARIDRENRLRTFIHFDFVYSSACLCSAELAEHARDVRNVFAISHSQRSKARVVAEIEPEADLSIEDLHEHCLRALHTETQVMVKREDEQAFAEMNGASMKFVEDAARMVFEQLDSDPRIRDFEVACSPLESIHSHAATSVVAKRVPGGFQANFDDFGSLVC